MGNKIKLFAKIITVSDGVSTGHREDISGQKIQEFLEGSNWEIVSRSVIPDGIESVSEELLKETSNFHGLIVTTGGTGFGPRDFTPEGTKLVLEREAPGIAEALIATAAGLFAAIPAVIFFNYLNNKVFVLTSSMDDFCQDFIYLAEKNFMPSNEKDSSLDLLP